MDNNYIVEVALLFIVFFSNVYTPSFLPMPLKMVTPSLGWCCTLTILSSQSLVFALVITILHVCVVFQLWRCYGGSLFFRRLAYFPLIGSILAVFLGVFIVLPNPSVTLWLSLLSQLYAVLCGIIMALCYPSLFLTATTAQINRDREYENLSPTLRDNFQCTAERILIHCAVGFHLDTVVLCPIKPSAKWVLYLKGNGEFLEQTLAAMAPLSQQLDANIIIYNPRGVGRSTGYPIRVHDFVEDAELVTSFYSSRYGFVEENLLLLGHSFGGGIAAELARKRFPHSPLVIDRSFSRLSDSVASVTRVWGSFVGFFVSHLSRWSIGDLSSIAAWNDIHHERKIIIFAKRDEVISYADASIARLPQFQPGEPQSAMLIELHCRNISSWHNCNLTFFDEGPQILLRMNRLYPTSQ